MSSEARGGFGSGLVAGLTLGLALAALIGLVGGFFSEDRGSAVGNAQEVIEDNYFEAVSSEELDQSSIRGMVDELRRRYDDDFTHYFNPKQLEEFESSTSGKFEGVGLTVNEVPRGLRVAAVLPDTPAERAEIEEGDVVTAVDGESIAGVPSEVATARIKGPPGSMVELRVISAETGKAREIELERASIRVPAVRGEIRRVDGRRIAYIQFATFSEGAHGELRDEIERLLRDGAEGIVLDLRGNGGGLLNEAILASSLFVEDGTVVSTRSRTQGDRDYEAVGDAFDSRPLVVLVNRDSASAAEILTAALDHYDLAEIVGTRTYGKGTFQEVIPVPAGGALDLTIGQYLTADGSSLADEGVEPDVVAKDDPKTERRDEARDVALEVLRDQLTPTSP